MRINGVDRSWQIKYQFFIINSEGKHFELSNEKMAIMMACDSSTNWDVVFHESISPYDIIISDFHNSKAPAFGFGYSLVQHCDTKEQAEKIITECRDKLPIFAVKPLALAMGI